MLSSYCSGQFNHNIETLQNMRLAVEGIFKEGLHKRGINDVKYFKSVQYFQFI